MSDTDPNDDESLWVPSDPIQQATQNERQVLLDAEKLAKQVRTRRDWLRDVLAGARTLLEHGPELRVDLGWLEAAAEHGLASAERELLTAYELESEARTALNVRTWEVQRDRERNARDNERADHIPGDEQ